MRDRFADALMTLARSDSSVMFVTGDLGFGVFEKFQEAFPEQYLNVGVAEQNMIAVSAGLALEGRTVFAYSIGNFPVLRCLEQIRNDVAYHGANVKVVSIGGGFSYGPLGMSHHATEDIAIMRAIPSVTSFAPGTSDDVADAVRALVTTSGAGYLRLDKSEGHETPTAEPFSVGGWRIMSEGTDVVIVAVGGVLGEAQKAAELLETGGISARVVNATQIAPVSNEEVLRCLGNVVDVVTVEEHVTRGGLAGVVAEALATSGSRARLWPKGIHEGFMSAVGSQAYLRRQVGLDAESIAASVEKIRS